MNISIEPTLRSHLETAGYVVNKIESMPEGGSNWLFKVTLEDGQILVARTPKFGKAKFKMERALLEAAKGGSIPVPVVIDLVETPCLPILLTTYLVGASLDEVASNLERDQLSTVAWQIGRTLGKIHALNLGTLALARITIGHMDWAMRTGKEGILAGARLALQSFAPQN